MTGRRVRVHGTAVRRNKHILVVVLSCEQTAGQCCSTRGQRSGCGGASSGLSAVKEPCEKVLFRKRAALGMNWTLTQSLTADLPPSVSHSALPSERCSVGPNADKKSKVG